MNPSYVKFIIFVLKVLEIILFWWTMVVDLNLGSFFTLFFNSILYSLCNPSYRIPFMNPFTALLCTFKALTLLTTNKVSSSKIHINAYKTHVQMESVNALLTLRRKIVVKKDISDRFFNWFNAPTRISCNVVVFVLSLRILNWKKWFSHKSLWNSCSIQSTWKHKRATDCML